MDPGYLAGNKDTDIGYFNWVHASGNIRAEDDFHVNINLESGAISYHV